MVPVRHIDKLGVAGAVFAGLCSLEIPPFVAMLSALGLGWLLDDAAVIYVLFASLLIVFAPLALGAGRHRNPLALFVATLGGTLLVSSVLVSHGSTTTYLGMALLIAASWLNDVLGRPLYPDRKPS